MGEEEEERQGCTNERRSSLVLWAAPGLYLYRGEGGCAPFRVSHPQGVRPALDGKGEAAKGGEEREAHQYGP